MKEINHDITKNKIFDIAGLLREQARYAKDCKKKQLELIDDETLAQEYKNSRIAELRETYLARYEDTKEKVNEKLNEILEVELEQEKILNYDIPGFTNTIAAINAAKGKLPPEVMEGIKLNFAGNYLVMQSIKAAFESYEVDLSKYDYEDYMTSASAAIEPIMQAANNIERDEVSTVVSLYDIFKSLIHFGEVRGIEFTENAKIFGDGLDGEIEEIYARRVMGLPE